MTASNFRWITFDPGEDAGWSVWKGVKLLGAGTAKLWPLADEVWSVLNGEADALLGTGDRPWLRSNVTPEENSGKLELFVIEKFALYPKEAKSLAWNEFRTVQLIGALTFMARVYGVDVHKQPASIKERAKAGGAEELFYRPLHQNRHQNDAIMHGVFYSQVEMLQNPFSVPDSAADHNVPV